MDAVKILVGSRKKNEAGAACHNKMCPYNKKVFSEYIYAKKVRGKIVWICFHCAKLVDKII
jgi:hypothetical protein